MVFDSFFILYVLSLLYVNKLTYLLTRPGTSAVGAWLIMCVKYYTGLETIW